MGGDYHVKFHKQSSEIIREKIHDHIALLSVFSELCFQMYNFKFKAPFSNVFGAMAFVHGFWGTSVWTKVPNLTQNKGQRKHPKGHDPKT